MDETRIEIPWSVGWSGEQEFRLQPSRDFPGAVELDQKQAQGAGEPIFAMMHVTRQRRAMVDLLCHVCGRPTSKQDRYLFPTASGGLVTLHDGSQLYGCNVPPMHRACTSRAGRNCPHLLKIEEPALRIGPDVGRVVPRTDVTPGLEPFAERIPPGAEVVFSCYRLFGPEFTAKVVRARAEWAALSRARRAKRGAAVGG